MGGINDITEGSVHKWMFDHGHDHENAWESRHDLIKDVTGNKLSPSGAAILRSVLRKMWKASFPASVKPPRFQS